MPNHICGIEISGRWRRKSMICGLVGVAIGHAAQSSPTVTGIREPAQPTEEELRAFLRPEPRKTPAEALQRLHAVLTLS